MEISVGLELVVEPVDISRHQQRLDHESVCKAALREHTGVDPIPLARSISFFKHSGILIVKSYVKYRTHDVDIWGDLVSTAGIDRIHELDLRGRLLDRCRKLHP